MDDQRRDPERRRQEQVQPSWRAPYELLMFALMIVFIVGFLRGSDRTMGAALGPYGLGQMADGYLRLTNWRGLGAARHREHYRRWGTIYLLGGLAMVFASFYLLRTSA
jgi:hypothetical protein